MCCFEVITVDFFCPAVLSRFGKSYQSQLEFPTVFHMQVTMQFNLYMFINVVGISSIYILIWYTYTHKYVHSKRAFIIFRYISISKYMGDTDH